MNRPTRRHIVRWSIAGLGALLTAMVLAAVVILSVDLGRFNPFLEAVASLVISQEISVDGDLGVLVGG